MKWLAQLVAAAVLTTPVAASAQSLTEAQARAVITPWYALFNQPVQGDMRTRDPPQLRLGRLRRHAIKELPGLHLPSPQVLSQDRRLRVVREFFDADCLPREAEPQLTA